MSYIGSYLLYGLILQHYYSSHDQKLQNESSIQYRLSWTYNSKGEHDKAVDCILEARRIFEESVPELGDVVFDSIEEVIKRLPARVKFDVASQDWIRIVYLVKSLKSNYETERDYVKRGVSWEFLFDIRKKSLGPVGEKYLWSKEKLGIKGNGAAAIAKTYGAMCAIIGSPKVELTEKKEECCEIRIPACWQYSVMKSMGLDKEPGWVECSCMCAEHVASIAEAINPDVDFEFTSTLPDGCKYCEGVFQLSKFIAKKTSKSEVLECHTKRQ